jgi:sarcosine oxidase subunit beta
MEAEVGVPTEVVTGEEARRELPILSRKVLAASWCGLDGYANPLLVTPAYLKAARRHGAEVNAFSAVTAIDRHGSNYTVHTKGRRWSTPVVVDVSGPRIAEVAALAGIRIEMSPVAIQMHVTVRIPETMRYLVQHIGEGLSVKQVTAGNILIGGGWPAARLDLDARSTASTHSMAGNLWQACRLLPLIRDLRLLRMWAGPLAATPDEMPVIGEVPGSPGFFIAGGTYAFTLAPLWGRVLQALIEGRTPPLEISDLSPLRLLPDTATRTSSA